MSGQDDNLSGYRFDTQTLMRLKGRKRERTSSMFIKGPINLDWALDCAGCHRDGLLLALGLRMMSDITGDNEVKVGSGLGTLLKLTPDRRRSALAALEQAGLAEVRKEPGSAPVARLKPHGRQSI